MGFIYGNRGGALVNNEGEMIGLITGDVMQINGQAVPNANFAIGTNHIKPVIREFIE